MKTEARRTMELNDAELVAESLAGNREAFRQIVERYQTLISSLTYCATGNVSQSEDLAQEIFLAAWKELAELREPAKLRPWLCSIARFRISKNSRHQGHEPVHEAESLEAVEAWASPEPLPLDHAISEEEKAILWRALERVPEIYREPLVLFYRGDHSVEAVAELLDLSEDAVKQRLSRGRKHLQEQLLAFVGGALKQTHPARTFAIGVVAALPLLAPSAKAATVTVAAGKGGPVTKGIFGAALINGFVLFFSLFGVFGFAGRWAGRTMWRSRQSARGRRHIIQFWQTLAMGFLLFVLPLFLIPYSVVHTRRWLYHAETWSLALFYGVVAAALAVWIWQRWHDIRDHDGETSGTPQTAIKPYNLWVVMGMLGPALILVKFLFSFYLQSQPRTWHYIPISASDARQIISKRTNAWFMAFQYHDGSKSLIIHLPENQGTSLYTPLDDSLVAALAERKIIYRTPQVGYEPFKGEVLTHSGGIVKALLQLGRGYQGFFEDWQVHNAALRDWLVMISIAIVAAGSVLLLRRPGIHCRES